MGIASSIQTAIFSLLAYSISWSLWLPVVFGGSSSASVFVLVLLLLGACVPSLAALLLTGVREGRSGLKVLLGGLLRWRVGLRWYAAVIVGMPALGLLAVVLHDAFGGPPLTFSPALPWVFLPVAFLLSLLGGPLNEEIGWRGYALPRLQDERSALSSGLILGAAWCFWHLPLFFVAGTSRSEMPFLPYLACVVALSVLFTPAYNGAGGSLVIAVLAHGAFNVTAGVLFPILPVPVGEDAGPAAVSVGADGPVPFLILTSLLCLVALIVVLLKGRNLSYGRSNAG